ncbi:MAG: hypothetical protein R3F59_16775 [Myxococcota bacterium]
MLVGVDDYRVFDPSGALDLAGSVEDVGLWRSVCERLGAVAPEVLTAPLRADGARALGAATRDRIGAAFQGLLDALADPAPGPRQGVFVFAGHGLQQGDGLALCATDHAPGSPRLVLLQELLDRVRDACLAADRSLTLVLDCCFSGELGGAVAGARPRVIGEPVRRTASALRRYLGQVALPPGVVVVGAGDRAVEAWGPAAGPAASASPRPPR